MLPRLSTNPVLVGSDHGRAYFMKEQESLFVTRNTKLALELNGRDTRCMGRDQIHSPKPDKQRRAGLLHDRPGSEQSAFAALPATKDSRTLGEPVRLAGFMAMRAHETIHPTRSFQIRRAGRVVRKHLLKFGQRAGERKVFSVKNIHNYDGHVDHFDAAILLHLVVVGANRIGKQ